MILTTHRKPTQRRDWRMIAQYEPISGERMAVLCVIGTVGGLLFMACYCYFTSY